MTGDEDEGVIDYLGPFYLGPNETASNGIYTGDARELAKAIPDESVDLVFTDPPWEEYPAFFLMFEIANRILKPGAFLLFYCGVQNVPGIVRPTVGLLDYRSIFCVHHQGDIHQFWPNRLFEWWTPIAWYSKGQPEWVSNNMIASVVRNKKSKRHHSWEQGIDPALYYIRELTRRGSVLVDPFVGGGTFPAACKMLGRRYLAFEIDPAVAQTARDRVRQTPAPLFTVETEQAPLFAEVK